jgi:hypothetical protein
VRGGAKNTLFDVLTRLSEKDGFAVLLKAIDEQKETVDPMMEVLCASVGTESLDLNNCVEYRRPEEDWVGRKPSRQTSSADLQRRAA